MAQFAGLRRWSRLGEWCTQAQCPQPPGATLRPLPRPASVILWLVCLCWRSCDSGERRGVVLRGPRRACLQLIDAGRSAPCPFREAPLTAHSAPSALRAAGINTNNDVRGRGRGSGAGAQRLSSVQTGLLVGVRAPRRCPLAEGGMVKGRQCARMCNTEDKLFSAWQQGLDMCVGEWMCSGKESGTGGGVSGFECVGKGRLWHANACMHIGGRGAPAVRAQKLGARALSTAPCSRTGSCVNRPLCVEWLCPAVPLRSTMRCPTPSIACGTRPQTRSRPQPGRRTLCWARKKWVLRGCTH